MTPFQALLAFLLLFPVLFPPTMTHIPDSIFHEELPRTEQENELRPLFLTEVPTKQLISKPKRCLRKTRPLHKSVFKGKNKHIYVSTWMNFMNEFYWDNGDEYSKWTHIAQEGKMEQEPSYMVPSVIIPVLFYMLSMLVTAILTPFISFILFRSFYFVWGLISHNRMRNILRKIWTINEIRKRKQIQAIYMWERQVPKMRSQLPWILRRHPDEEVPNDLKDFIASSSSAESSVGEANLDFYYDGDEEDEVLGGMEASRRPTTTIGNKAKKSTVTAVMGKKKGKLRVAPWRLAHKSQPVEEEAGVLPVQQHQPVGVARTKKSIVEGSTNLAEIVNKVKGVDSGEEFHI